MFKKSKGSIQQTKSPDRSKPGKLQLGLRSKMILRISIPLVLILTVVGIVLHNQISHTVENIKQIEIEAQNTTAAATVESFFDPLFTAAELAESTDDFVALIQDAAKPVPPAYKCLYTENKHL